MRKELLVFVNTLEKGEEISVTSVAKNRDYVIIGTPNGTKVTASRKELVEALNALEEFDSSNNASSTNLVESVSEPGNSVVDDVQYGGE